MRGNDAVYIHTAVFGQPFMEAPVSPKSFRQRVKRLKRNKSNARWYANLVNSSNRKGMHWGCVVWHTVSDEMFHLEPYNSAHLLNVIKATFPKILITCMGDQPRQNRWACGYIAVWYQLVVHHRIVTNSIELPFSPESVPAPPVEWVPLCLLLLANRRRGQILNCNIQERIVIALSLPSPDLSALFLDVEAQMRGNQNERAL